MNTKSLLEQLLQSGQQLAQRGFKTVEQQANVPAQGPERDAMLSGLGKGALAGGVVALLLGSKGGRSLTGGLLKYGSLAALGGLAYTTYKNWQNSQGDAATPPPGQPVGELQGPVADRRSLALLKAIIAAAKADGHIDAEEQQKIEAQIARFGLDNDTLTMLQKELEKPLNPSDIAAGADSPEAAAEIYLASLLVINVDNFMERAYLDELARLLGLAPDLVAQLEAEAGH